MILDSIKNAELYYSLNPRLQTAFEWLAKCNVKTISCGKHQIDGDDVFVNVMELDLKPRYDALLEIHDKYIDIEAQTAIEVGAVFDTEKDIQLFTDQPQTFYTLREGQFTILMPDDAHAPMLGTGHIKKLIFKVRK